jgi:hypothetical protein
MASVVPTSRAPRHRERRRARPWAVAAFATMLLATSGGLATGVAASAPLGDPAVISNWNLIAQTTLLGDTTKRPQEHFLYLAFLNIAMYDAVVGIDGRYVPYMGHASPAADASDQAAAIAAAHRILETYSPYAQVTLDIAYNTAQDAIPHVTAAEILARQHGLDYGTLVANDLIALRANDGRNANITFAPTPAPGVWRPTPPALLAMFVPWMGSVTPLVTRSGAQFGEPGPPPPMTSKRYTTDYNEVKAMGGNAATGSDRTDDQTTTALFFSGNAQVQFTGALIDQADIRNLDIVDNARMFAAVNTSIADALIAVWHSKVHYGFWRPITAINLGDTDGNPDTEANASWVPLLTTPPYPDYVSGYSGVAGAFTRSLQKSLGTGQLDVTLRSTVITGVTRHYDTAGALNETVIDARIWLGIHFRFADVDGVKMGQHAANWVLDHAFQPIGG